MHSARDSHNNSCLPRRCELRKIRNRIDWWSFLPPITHMLICNGQQEPWSQDQMTRCALTYMYTQTHARTYVQEEKCFYICRSSRFCELNDQGNRWKYISLRGLCACDQSGLNWFGKTGVHWPGVVQGAGYSERRKSIDMGTMIAIWVSISTKSITTYN